MSSLALSVRVRRPASGICIWQNKSRSSRKPSVCRCDSPEETMSAEIRVPSLGESIVDATIASWLKHEGDVVKSGDALVELETDKINVEINAEHDGVLQQVTKPASAPAAMHPG